MVIFSTFFHLFLHNAPYFLRYAKIHAKFKWHRRHAPAVFATDICVANTVSGLRGKGAPSPTRFAVETVESRSAFPPFPPLPALPHPQKMDGQNANAFLFAEHMFGAPFPLRCAGGEPSLEM